MMTDDGDSAPLLLTPREVAELLNCDVTELRRWRAQNIGPEFYTLGRGLTRYARASVIEEAVNDVGSLRDRSRECRWWNLGHLQVTSERTASSDRNAIS